ncbi:DUF6210 family protein [Streptomyces sp. NBC_01217]|uniref:DUF6210 family protein n=1 Tax=Streptomyces sp. NBC_01217 TaxID=2903779 RepID=UPI002E104017|nr:DUF6210 family protein [Streptomyces sp. NBC_01217]
MSSPRYVFLDPDGTATDWLYVVVTAPTDVVYQQQYGGTACRQGEAEGFLVPLHAPDELGALRQLFERHFRGAGTSGRPWTPDERAALHGAVEGIRYWFNDGVDDHPHELRWDEARLDETDEAWVPVLTPDGPGVLLWCNSD